MHYIKQIVLHGFHGISHLKFALIKDTNLLIINNDCLDKRFCIDAIRYIFDPEYIKDQDLNQIFDLTNNKDAYVELLIINTLIENQSTKIVKYFHDTKKIILNEETITVENFYGQMEEIGLKPKSNLEKFFSINQNWFNSDVKNPILLMININNKIILSTIGSVVQKQHKLDQLIVEQKIEKQVCNSMRNDLNKNEKLLVDKIQYVAYLIMKIENKSNLDKLRELRIQLHKNIHRNTTESHEINIIEIQIENLVKICEPLFLFKEKILANTFLEYKKFTLEDLQSKLEELNEQKQQNKMYSNELKSINNARKKLKQQTNLFVIELSRKLTITKQQCGFLMAFMKSNLFKTITEIYEIATKFYEIVTNGNILVFLIVSDDLKYNYIFEDNTDKTNEQILFEMKENYCYEIYNQNNEKIDEGTYNHLVQLSLLVGIITIFDLKLVVISDLEKVFPDYISIHDVISNHFENDRQCLISQK